MKLAWKQIIPALLIGALAGAAAGAWCQRYAFRNFWQHGPNPSRLLAKLDRELTLEPRQKEALKALLEAQHAKVMALHGEMSAKFEAMLMETRGETRKLLNAGQQKKFDELSARWDAHRRRFK